MSNYKAIEELDDYCIKNLDCNWGAWRDADYRDDKCETELLIEVQKILNTKQGEIQDLEAKLAKAVEALRFYATEADLFEGYPHDDYSLVTEDNLSVEVLGKRARQTLAELSEKGE